MTIVLSEVPLLNLVETNSAQPYSIEPFYHDVFENVLQGIAITNQHGEILDCNSRLCEILGYSREELLQLRVHDLLHPSYFYVFEELRSQAQENGRFFGECLDRRKDGSFCPIEVIGTPLVYQNKPAALCFVRDITERKRAEDALRESELLYRSIFETCTDAITIVDENDYLVQCNPAFCQMFGYEEHEILGQAIQKIIHPAYRYNLAVFNEQVATKGRGYIESMDIRKDGVAFPIEVVGAAINLAGKPAILGFIRDITQRKGNEQQILQHQMELAHAARLCTIGEMASGMAHELNQPLAAIVNYSQGCIRRLESGKTPVHELVHALEKITKQAQRASSIIAQLRKFMQKDAIHTAPVNVNTILREAVSFLDIEFKKHKNVLLQWALTTSLPPVLADKLQLEQVVVNILKNALDASPIDEQKINVIRLETLLQDNDTILISIKDTGLGMTPEVLKRIFEPFYTTKAEGMGMGLAICRTLIEKLGGELQVETCFNEGSHFQIVLPIKESEEVICPQK